jgi:hypothetical protein
MVSPKARRGWQIFAAVAPLLVVIFAALFWSSYATFHYVQSDKVPADVAWTMVAALDGTVVVTTPIWLSTVLLAPVRRYAAIICALALVGSMVLNYAETGWPGLFPPLIAGLLIHLVGITLRALAALNKGGIVEDKVDVSAKPDIKPEIKRESAPPSVKPVPEKTVVLEKKLAPVAPPVVPAASPVSTSMPGGLAPQEIVFWLLNEAHATDGAQPTGPELTAAVRAAGHIVNDEYGRTTRARWAKARKEVNA